MASGDSRDIDSAVVRDPTPGDNVSGVSEDVLFIRETIKKELEILAKEIENDVFSSEKLSVEIAEGLVFRDATLQENSAVGDIIGWVTEIVQRFKRKTPHFLIIQSLLEPEGSKRRENERRQRELEGEHLMELYGLNNKRYRETRKVKSYKEMLEEIVKYVSNRNGSELPIILFLGHGDTDGRLCFLEEPSVHCYDVISKVAEIFKENRPEGMASSQLRFVFSQCYGHLVDDKDKAGVVRGLKIEYIYVTDYAQPLSSSSLPPAKPNITQIQAMFDEFDVHLELPGDHSKVEGAVTHLKDKFPNFKDIIPRRDLEIDSQIRSWLRDGPQARLLSEIQRRKKKLKIFLHLSCSAPATEVFGIFTIPPFDCHKKQIETKDELFSAIDSFLLNEASDVVMPVVLMEGTGTVDASGKLVLHINDDRVSVDDIHHKYRHVDEMRFVFRCHQDGNTQAVDAGAEAGAEAGAGVGAGDSSNVVWFSNALLPDVTWATHDDLQRYRCAIIGDGPKNKTL